MTNPLFSMLVGNGVDLSSAGRESWSERIARGAAGGLDLFGAVVGSFGTTLPPPQPRSSATGRGSKSGSSSGVRVSGSAAAAASGKRKRSASASASSSDDSSSSSDEDEDEDGDSVFEGGDEDEKRPALSPPSSASEAPVAVTAAALDKYEKTAAKALRKAWAPSTAALAAAGVTSIHKLRAIVESISDLPRPLCVDLSEELVDLSHLRVDHHKVHEALRVWKQQGADFEFADELVGVLARRLVRIVKKSGGDTVLTCVLDSDAVPGGSTSRMTPMAMAAAEQANAALAEAGTAGRVVVLQVLRRRVQEGGSASGGGGSSSSSSSSSAAAGAKQTAKNAPLVTSEAALRDRVLRGADQLEVVTKHIGTLRAAKSVVFLDDSAKTAGTLAEHAAVLVSEGMPLDRLCFVVLTVSDVRMHLVRVPLWRILGEGIGASSSTSSSSSSALAAAAPAALALPDSRASLSSLYSRASDRTSAAAATAPAAPAWSTSRASLSSLYSRASDRTSAAAAAAPAALALPDSRASTSSKSLMRAFRASRTSSSRTSSSSSSSSSSSTPAAAAAAAPASTSSSSAAAAALSVARLAAVARSLQQHEPALATKDSDGALAQEVLALQAQVIIYNLERGEHARLWREPLQAFPRPFTPSTAIYVLIFDFGSVGHAKRVVAYMHEHPGLVDADVVRAIEKGLEVAAAQGASDDAPFSVLYTGQSGGGGDDGTDRIDSHARGDLLVDRAARQLCGIELIDAGLIPSSIEYREAVSHAQLRDACTTAGKGARDGLDIAEALVAAMTRSNVRDGGFNVAPAGYLFCHPAAQITAMANLSACLLSVRIPGLDYTAARAFVLTLQSVQSLMSGDPGFLAMLERRLALGAGASAAVALSALCGKAGESAPTPLPPHCALLWLPLGAHPVLSLAHPLPPFSPPTPLTHPIPARVLLLLLAQARRAWRSTVTSWRTASGSSSAPATWVSGAALPARAERQGTRDSLGGYAPTLDRTGRRPLQPRSATTSAALLTHLPPRLPRARPSLPHYAMLWLPLGAHPIPSLAPAPPAPSLLTSHPPHPPHTRALPARSLPPLRSLPFVSGKKGGAYLSRRGWA
jgi:hypothetical protein